MASKLRASLFALLLGALSLGAAGPRNAVAATPADTLVIARDVGSIISLDPQEAFEIATGDLLNALYLRLVRHDPDDFSRIVGGAVENWQRAEDGRGMRFVIRKGLKFQSGNPVTADDAAFSLRRGIQMAKPPAIILRQFGWTAENVEQMVRAEGDELVLQFDQAYPQDLVLSALATAIASVVDRKLVMANARDNDMGNGWLKSRSAGAGPYRLVAWKPKEGVVLEAFPGYVFDAPRLKRVIVRHVAEPAAQRLLLEKGDVDVASDLNPDQVDALAASKAVQITRIPRGTVYYFAMNTSRPELAKPKVWEAMRWLVDYEGISGKLFRGLYAVNQAPVAQGVPSALTDQPYRLDVPRAKKLLAEAGYPDGFAISMDVMTASPYREIAQSLQNTFAQAGIRLELKVSDSAQMMARYRERRHDTVVFVWAPDYSDPSSTIEFFSRNTDNAPDAANRNAAWRNHWLIPQLTQQTQQAAVEPDAKQRMQRYQQIQQAIRESSPFVFVLQQVNAIAHRSDVSGYTGNVTFDSTPYERIDKRR